MLNLKNAFLDITIQPTIKQTSVSFTLGTRNEEEAVTSSQARFVFISGLDVRPQATDEVELKRHHITILSFFHFEVLTNKILLQLQQPHCYSRRK